METFACYCWNWTSCWSWSSAEVFSIPFADLYLTFKMTDWIQLASLPRYCTFICWYLQYLCRTSWIDRIFWMLSISWLQHFLSSWPSSWIIHSFHWSIFAASLLPIRSPIVPSWCHFASFIFHLRHKAAGIAILRTFFAGSILLSSFRSLLSSSIEGCFPRLPPHLDP